MAGSIAFDIFARDRASTTFRRVGDEAERTHRKVGLLSGAFGGLAKAGAAFAGAAAIAGVASVLRDSVGQARESNKVSALTAQAIKSTGGAAHVTAKQVGELSNAIAAKTGIDDEAIQSGANLLLTFTGIRNEVGKGNDIFNRATATITDMSVALGQDTSSSAIQLGKALNDPIRGVTALQRVGVSFTAAQRKQITGLVEHGHKLEAQKIILKELSTEFGGAAAAAGTSTQKMSVAFGNIKERIGNALIPLLDRLAGFITSKVLPGVNKFFDALQSGGKGTGQINSFVRQLLSGLGDLRKAWADNKKEIVPMLKLLGPILGAVIVGVVRSINTSVIVIGAMSKAFKFLASTTHSVLAFVVTQFLNFAGTVISAAARAFGWVPGIGPKLRRASKEFNSWAAGIKATVNKPLSWDVRVNSNARSVLAEVNALKAAVRSGAVSGQQGRVAIALSGRADGGPVRAGQPYIVGERRAELFVPDVDGTIVPSVPRTGQGSAGGDVYNVNISGALDPVAVGRQVQKVLLTLKRQTGGANLGLA